MRGGAPRECGVAGGCASASSSRRSAAIRVGRSPATRATRHRRRGAPSMRNCCTAHAIRRRANARSDSATVSRSADVNGSRSRCRSTTVLCPIMRAMRVRVTRRGRPASRRSRSAAAAASATSDRSRAGQSTRPRVGAEAWGAASAAGAPACGASPVAGPAAERPAPHAAPNVSAPWGPPAAAASPASCRSSHARSNRYK